MINLNCFFFCFLSFLFFFSHTVYTQNDYIINKENEKEIEFISDIIKTSSKPDDDSNIIILTTIDGTIHAIDYNTGLDVWAWSAGIPLVSSYVSENFQNIHIIPGNDGSLFFVPYSDKNYEIEKLSFSIQDLATLTPLRSQDGTRYIGNKFTEVFVLNKDTGEPLKIFSPGFSTFENENQNDFFNNSIWFARNEFYVSAVNEKNGNVRWNASFCHYISFFSSSIKNIDIEHLPSFYSSVDGIFYAVEKKTKEILWKKHLSSPLANIYLSSYQDIIPLVFTYTDEIPNQVIPITKSLVPAEDLSTSNKNQLYIGVSNNGQIYAISPQYTSNSLSLLPSSVAQINELSGFHLLSNHQSLSFSHINSTIPIVDTTTSTYPYWIYYFITTLFIILLSSFIFYFFVFKKDTPSNFIFDNKLILGYGAQGTIVYKGKFQGRDVAIKRLLLHLHPLASKEIDLLINIDHHANVVRYYASEIKGDFIYLALELCQCNLMEYLHQNISYSKKIQLVSDIVQGLNHLHNNNIVHRDLKPQNILVSIEGRAKIADMGLSKKLIHGQSSSFISSLPMLPSSSSHGKSNSENNNGSKNSQSHVGSSGWQSPEILLNQRQTKNLDIFSLGCIIYYILSDGIHPYGTVLERDINIIHQQFDVSLVDTIAADMIKDLICYDSDERLTCEEILDHPFFWSPEKKLLFLEEASDRIESDNYQSKLLFLLESRSQEVIGSNWQKKIHPSLIENIQLYRKYNFNTIRDCLRLIRNKRHHYRELPIETQELLGPLPGGFLEYFFSIFPSLFLYLYYVLGLLCWKEPNFQHFFQYMLLKTHQKLRNKLHIPCRNWWLYKP